LNYRLVLLIIFLTSKVASQQDPTTSFFFNQMIFFNPAYAGSNFSNEISFASRNQWTSIENSPRSQFFSLSSMRENNVGLGISLFSNKTFVERRTISYIDFSYKLELNSEKYIFLGLKGGADFLKTDITNIIGLGENQTFDPALNNESRILPNLGVGILFKSNKFFFSFSIPRMFSNETNELQFSGSNTNPIYLVTGYNAELNDNLSIKTNLFLKSSKGQKNSLQSSIVLNVNENFEIGLNYKTSNFLTPLMMVNLGQFKLGYAYEMPLINSISNLSVRTHEVLLFYNLNKKSEQVIEEE